MKYEFFNKKSEILYNKLLKRDKNGEFSKYFNSLKSKKTFYSSNGMPDNCFLSLVAFQAIEFYMKYDKNQMRKIFAKFSKLASNDNKIKYNNLISETNKIIDEMLANKYTTSKNTMVDFTFELNQKVVKSIKIFLDIVGTGIYRIGYNIYLQDEYYYKYWQIATKDFENLLEIKNIPLINRGKIKLHDGDIRKSNELIKFQRVIKSNIYKLIKNIAPGLFISLYKSIPIIMVLEADLISYYTKFGKLMFKFRNQEENAANLNNSFWEIIRKDKVGDQRDFYYNRTYCDMYIPSFIENYNNPIIFSKHFRNSNAFTPTNLLFVLEILSVFYKNQLNTVNNLKNNYLFSIIKSKIFLLFRSRKKLYKIDALIKLLNEAFNIEKREFENPYNEKLKYYLNNSYEYEIEYFKSYVDNIKYNNKLIEDSMPALKDIYDKLQNDQNLLSNTIFQIIGLILSIVIATLTIQQCNNSRQDDSNQSKERNIDCINNSQTIVRHRIQRITNVLRRARSSGLGFRPPPPPVVWAGASERDYEIVIMPAIGGPNVAN
jgi:hypothetical protein